MTKTNQIPQSRADVPKKSDNGGSNQNRLRQKQKASTVTADNAKPGGHDEHERGGHAGKK